MAWASVSSRTEMALVVWLRVALGVDMLVHLTWLRERRVEREAHACLDLSPRFIAHPLQLALASDAFPAQPLPKQDEGVALGLPVLFLLFGAVVGALDVTDVMAVEAIGVTKKKRRSLPVAGAVYQLVRGGVHGAHVLAVHLVRMDAERLRALRQRARGRLGEVRVFVVEV